MDNAYAAMVPRRQERRHVKWTMFVAGAFAMVLAGGVVAANAVDPNAAMPAQGQKLDLTKGSKLIGKGVVDAQNNKLGDIKDMAIDLSGNRIDYVVVGSGGMLGIGEKLYAVPAQVFGPFREDHDLVLNGSSQALKASPLPKDWLNTIDQAHLNAIYQRAGAAPPTDSDGVNPQRVKATELIGRGVVTDEGEKSLADVKEIAVSMQDGHVPFVLLEVNGAAMKDKYLAVPAAALTKGPVRDRLYISRSGQELNSAPGVDKDDWLQVVSDPLKAADIYVAYQITPYWTKQSNTAQGGGQATQQRPQGMGGATEEPSQTMEQRGGSPQ